MAFEEVALMTPHHYAFIHKIEFPIMGGKAGGGLGWWGTHIGPRHPTPPTLKKRCFSPLCVLQSRWKQCFTPASSRV